MINDEIRTRLFELRDEGYREFQAKLMPGVDIERIIGVRTPLLRKLAKEYAKRGDIGDFLEVLPHEYYDEMNLHGFIISELRDYHEAVLRVDAFLPFVDNWATCDLLSPKVFKKHRSELRSEIDRWIASDMVYTIRFGLEMAMSHFLDEDFAPEYLDAAAGIQSGEYYVNMMIAWYFATALAKQWDAVIGYIEGRRLPVWVHNKTIQKAIESYRITDEQKEYLRSMKVKG